MSSRPELKVRHLLQESSMVSRSFTDIYIRLMMSLDSLNSLGIYLRGLERLLGSLIEEISTLLMGMMHHSLPALYVLPAKPKLHTSGYLTSPGL